MSSTIRKSDAAILMALYQLSIPSTAEQVQRAYGVKKTCARGNIWSSLNVLVNLEFCTSKLETTPDDGREQHRFALTQKGIAFAVAYAQACEHIEKLGGGQAVRFFLELYAAHRGNDFRRQQAHETSTVFATNAGDRTLAKLVHLGLLIIVNKGKRPTTYRFLNAAAQTYELLNDERLAPLTEQAMPPLVRVAAALLSSNEPVALRAVASKAKVTPSTAAASLHTAMMRDCITRNEHGGLSIIREAMGFELRQLLAKHNVTA